MRENPFGEFLYRLRKEQGITQTALADALGVTNRAVSKWETGECFPETAQLIPLANILNVTVDELLKGRRAQGAQESRGLQTDEEETDAFAKTDSDLNQTGRRRETVCRDEAEDTEGRYRTCERATSREENVFGANGLVEKEQGKALTKREALAIAAGIALILVGVLMLVVLSQLGVDYAVYLPIFFALLSISVFLFVTTGMRKTVEDLSLSAERSKKARSYILTVAFGVSLIILGVIALIYLGERGFKLILPLCIFFAALTTGVFLLIFGGCLWSSFLKQTERPAPRENLGSEKTAAEKVLEALSGVIMMLATGIFLLLGFGWSLWHPGWVVFPVGVLLCGIVSTVAAAVKKK